MSHSSFCCAFRCCVVYSPCFPVWGEEKVMTIYDAGPLAAGPLCEVLSLVRTRVCLAPVLKPPSNPQNCSRKPWQRALYFLRQTLVCTKPWFKRDLSFCLVRIDQYKLLKLPLRNICFTKEGLASGCAYDNNTSTLCLLPLFSGRRLHRHVLSELCWRICSECRHHNEDTQTSPSPTLTL